MLCLYPLYGVFAQGISIHFDRTDVRIILQAIAKYSGINIIVGDTVQGKLTISLNNVPWEEALDSVLLAKQLGQKRSGNIIWVTTKDELMLYEEKVLKDKKIKERLQKLETRGFQLNYVQAQDLKEQLEGQNTLHKNTDPKNPHPVNIRPNILSPRGSVLAEPVSNQLFVTDTPEYLDYISALIKKLDTPMRQVAIEVKIVLMDKNIGRSLGLR
jgi:type IV pilus assembly protein PilQ